METKQKFNKVPPGLGKNHYEKQLVLTHRKEATKYLREQNYSINERKKLMAVYDKEVNIKNIIQIHTHYIGYFFDRLVTGNLQELIDNSTHKAY